MTRGQLSDLGSPAWGKAQLKVVGPIFFLSQVGTPMNGSGLLEMGQGQAIE
jgi:hypothetical protein